MLATVDPDVVIMFTLLSSPVEQIILPLSKMQVIAWIHHISQTQATDERNRVGS